VSWHFSFAWNNTTFAASTHPVLAFFHAETSLLLRHTPLLLGISASPSVTLLITLPQLTRERLSADWKLCKMLWINQ
jgi:hypothetical protein